MLQCAEKIAGAGLKIEDGAAPLECLGLIRDL